MEIFNTRKQRLAASYASEVEILETKVSQSQNLIKQIYNKFASHTISHEEYNYQLVEATLEMTKDETRIASCNAIVNWLAGKASERDSDSD